MKKFLILPFFLFVICIAYAQPRISVEEEQQEFNKVLRTGMSTYVELDEKDTYKAWKKLMKDYGKVSTSRGGEITVEEAVVPTISKDPVKIYSIVKETKRGIMVWWAIDMGTKYITQGDREYSGAKEVLYDFAVNRYKEDIQEQIEDAQDAIDDAKKDFDKVKDDHEDLKDDLKDNIKEKKELEQELENNARKKVQLENDLEQNKKDLESAEENVEKMEKALELIRQKMKNIK